MVALDEDDEVEDVGVGAARVREVMLRRDAAERTILKNMIVFGSLF